MMLAAGAFVLSSQVIVPLVFFKTQDVISEVMRKSVLGIASGFNDFAFDELKGGLGATRISAYSLVTDDKPKPRIDSQPSTEPATPPIEPAVLAVEEVDPIFNKYFYLTIPKLKIENALVEMNSPSLTPDRSLGHYTGSSLPGELGNSFIYGHSVLPWFYNPKNYLTIFSTLDKLNPGDTYNVVYKNKAYNYKVVYTETLTPSDVNPLAEFRPKQLNESTMTLMTCWPVGMKSKRLLVRSILIK